MIMWSAPATLSMLAISFAEMGARLLSFLSWRAYGKTGMTAVTRAADAIYVFIRQQEEKCIFVVVVDVISICNVSFEVSLTLQALIIINNSMILSLICPQPL